MVREYEMAVQGKANSGPRGRKPEWAQGLKKMYDSVVEEPLPDDLAALLARLDDAQVDNESKK
jgi:Anti-sigma factor NepR